MPAHLRPTAKIAPDVLLPADPGQALALAQRLLVKPAMANHSYGLWGYSGVTPAGHELTIQSTGIGGPSTAIVATELAAQGARRAVRLGRARSLVPGLGLGEIALVGRALAEDGTAGALAEDGTAGALADRSALPDPALAAALGRAWKGPVAARSVVSFDLLYDRAAEARRTGWVSAGAELADLESAALLAVGRRLGLAAAAALVVAETADGAEDDALVEERLLALGQTCAAALAREPGPGQASGS